MKRHVLATAAVLLVSAVSQTQAQTPDGFAWLVHAISNDTGRPIDPIGADTEEEAQKKVKYLKSFPPPGFSAVRYERNPQVGGAPPRRRPPQAPQGPQAPSRPPVNPSLPDGGTAPVPAKLVGSTFSGSESLNGYGSLTFKFLDGQRVVMVDAKDTVPGRWEKGGGNTVYLYFYDDQCVYRGTLTGNVLQGTARSAKSSWSWSVKLQ